MECEISFDRKGDGRWIAAIESLPGVLAYGDTQIEAYNNVMALALRVIADKVEREQIPVGEVHFRVPRNETKS